MQVLLKNIQDPNVRIFVLWSPILHSDFRSAAEDRATEFYDRRMIQIWDVNGLASYQYESVLKVGTIVWDAYLVYGKDAQWSKTPTEPDFWMQQRPDELPGPLLNEPELEVKVNDMLKKPASK